MWSLHTQKSMHVSLNIIFIGMKTIFNNSRSNKQAKKQLNLNNNKKNTAWMKNLFLRNRLLGNPNLTNPLVETAYFATSTCMSKDNLDM